MNIQDKLVIGLFGFGVVGEGIYKVLQQTPSLNAIIKKVVIRDPSKPRNAPGELFSTDKNEILNDPGINLVVELIDDADEAYHIVSTALKSKKAVVSANKRMIAEHFAELIYLQQQNRVSFLYEAAVCGSIPIIRNLEEYYDNDLLKNICGIVNGSTNFILTRVTEGDNYSAALRNAQQLGFAETDPSLDVEGKDAINKLSILLAHGYGIITDPHSLLHAGINRLDDADALYAREKGYVIKLCAQARKLSNGKIAAFVLPQFVKPSSQLYHVKNEYNGVVIETHLADKQFLYGKGAGRYPTSSAVISDISALRYNYRYEYKKLKSKENYSLAQNYFLRIYVSYHHHSRINKMEFEHISEYHSTENRQYLTGIIHVSKLRNAIWFNDPQVSVVLLPDAIVEQDHIITDSLKRVSLQLAGVSQ